YRSTSCEPSGMDSGPVSSGGLLAAINVARFSAWHTKSSRKGNVLRAEAAADETTKRLSTNDGFELVSICRTSHSGSRHVCCADSFILSILMSCIVIARGTRLTLRGAIESTWFRNDDDALAESEHRLQH